MNGKVKNFIDNIEKYAIFVNFSVLLLLMIVQVIARYLFNIAWGWAEEVSRVLFVWLCFLGISLGAKNRAHLRVEAAAQFSPAPVARVLYLIGDLVTTVFAGYISYKILELTIGVYEKGQRFPATPWMPVWVIYVIGFIGMGGMCLRTIQMSVIPGIKNIINPPEKNAGTTATK